MYGWTLNKSINSDEQIPRPLILTAVLATTKIPIESKVVRNKLNTVQPTLIKKKTKWKIPRPPILNATNPTTTNQIEPGFMNRKLKHRFNVT